MCERDWREQKVDLSGKTIVFNCAGFSPKIEKKKKIDSVSPHCVTLKTKIESKTFVVVVTAAAH